MAELGNSKLLNRLFRRAGRVMKSRLRHRVLKPDRIMAAWMFPVAGRAPGSIRRSGRFTELDKQNGVYAYRPCQTGR